MIYLILGVLTGIIGGSCGALFFDKYQPLAGMGISLVLYILCTLCTLLIAL